MKRNYVVPNMKKYEIRKMTLLAGSTDPYQDPRGEQTGGESSGEDY